MDNLNDFVNSYLLNLRDFYYINNYFGKNKFFYMFLLIDFI